MPKIKPQMVLDIAKQVATHWYRKGIRGYSFEDMFQDAAMAALNAAASPSYIEDSSLTEDEREGKLRGYCYAAARNEVHHRCTRALTIASARGHDQTFALGGTKTYCLSPRIVQSIEDRERRVSPEIHDEDDMLHHLERKSIRDRVQRRLRRLLPNLATHELRTGVLTVSKSMSREQARQAGMDRSRLHAVMTSVRRKVQNDRKLYELAKELP